MIISGRLGSNKLPRGGVGVGGEYLMTIALSIWEGLELRVVLFIINFDIKYHRIVNLL